MKFHKFFSLKRFRRLTAADLRLNSRRYLYMVVGTAVGLYLVLLFGALSDTHDIVGAEYYATMFFLFLLVLGAYAGSAFPAFSEKSTTANYLLLPASRFEKLLSQFLIVIAGTVLFLFLFWANANLIRFSLSGLESVRTGKWIIQRFSYDIFFSHGQSVCDIFRNVFFVLIFFSTGCYLFTARLFFGKFALAKSIISGIALGFLFVCLLVLCSHLVFPEETEGFSIYYNVYHNVWDVRNLDIYVGSLCVIICLLFLPLAYFKLKEKQL